MDTATGLLLVLTSFVFGIFVSIRISENEKKNEENKKEETHRQQRTERINKLSGRS